MQDYYTIPADKFAEHRDYDFRIVKTHKDLCQEFARELVDLIQTNLSKNQMTKVILPVGPLDYQYFAEYCNQQGVSCESLVIFSMDEYVLADNSAVSINHPLSFRAFYQNNLLDRLDNDKKLPDEQLILPDPSDLDLVHRKMEKYGSIDVTYGGFGINGHFAFNSPPIEDVDLDTFKETSVRILTTREGDTIQMAIGGTMGNLEMIPPKGCTLGMKELLAAEMIHLTFMRSWHAGVMRRALFGPITPKFPGSLVQLHHNVRVTITELGGKLPPVSILQSPGK
ncbi:6-phosphogluconolactonase [Chloroflexota bacterium]